MSGTLKLAAVSAHRFIITCGDRRIAEEPHASARFEMPRTQVYQIGDASNPETIAKYNGLLEIKDNIGME